MATKAAVEADTNAAGMKAADTKAGAEVVATATCFEGCAMHSRKQPAACGSQIPSETNPEVLAFVRLCLNYLLTAGFKKSKQMCQAGLERKGFDWLI